MSRELETLNNLVVSSCFIQILLKSGTSHQLRVYPEMHVIPEKQDRLLTSLLFSDLPVCKIMGGSSSIFQR